MTNKQAQITINAIKFMLDHAQYSDDVEEALNMAISALTEQRWIPCSERLPKWSEHTDEMVLACDENGRVRFNTFMDGEWVSFEPIAWMPLPEPYQAERRTTDEGD